MPHNRHAKTLRELDADGLWLLALHYVSRYATTEAKLREYLARKLRERTWRGGDEPDLAEIVSRCAELGYVDDRAYAEAKSASLNRRGYGSQRIEQALHQSGIGKDLAAEVMPDGDAAVRAAESYARRRQFGRFGPVAPEREQRERQIAAMVRAGHSFTLARQIVTERPGEAMHTAIE